MPALPTLDGSPLEDPILGFGASGVVVARNGLVQRFNERRKSISGLGSVMVLSHVSTCLVWASGWSSWRMEICAAIYGNTAAHHQHLFCFLGFER